MCFKDIYIHIYSKQGKIFMFTLINSDEGYMAWSLHYSFRLYVELKFVKSWKLGKKNKSTSLAPNKDLLAILGLSSLKSSIYGTRTVISESLLEISNQHQQHLLPYMPHPTLKMEGLREESNVPEWQLSRLYIWLIIWGGQFKQSQDELRR